jgi:hypothetical protein
MKKVKLYKLTEQDNTTYHGSTLWGNNVTHNKRKKKNPQLCSIDLLHAYSNVNLAFLLNPCHANIGHPKLWEAEGNVVSQDWGKVGCFNLTTIRELPFPAWVGTEQEKLVRVAFAVLCAEAVLHFYEGKYPSDTRVRDAIEAAKNYLSNPSDKEEAAAAWAAEAAEAAAWAAWAAARAAWAAARAARAAARAAAWAAAEAAEAAEAAAWAAEAAARAAAAADTDIDFASLADTAVDMITRKP